MMYEVSGGQESVRVDGDNWLVALGASMDFFGLDPSGLARLAIDMQAGGVVKVKDPLTGRAFTLTPVTVETSAPVRLKLGAMKTALATLPPSEEEDLEEEPTAGGGSPPPFIMPTSIFAPPPELAPLPDDPVDTASPIGAPAAAPSPPPPPQVATISPVSEQGPVTAEVEPMETAEVPGVSEDLVGANTMDMIREDTGRASHVKAAAAPEDDRPEGLHEQLFFSSMDITAAGTVDEGCREALRILRELIPSESGAVLYASINDTELRFVTAFGPASRKIVGKAIPLDTGVAGFCHLRGVGMIINDADGDDRHDATVDRATGYHTRRLLTAGLRTRSGRSYGCIQLLNPPKDFRDWHLEATQVIASELSDFIALRQGQPE